MILTTQELQRMKKKTQFDDVYMYQAPQGYEFWSENTNYGSIIWAGDCLTNYYYLKEKNHEDNIKEDIHK